METTTATTAMGYDMEIKPTQAGMGRWVSLSSTHRQTKMGDSSSMHATSKRRFKTVLVIELQKIAVWGIAKSLQKSRKQNKTKKTHQGQERSTEISVLSGMHTPNLVS